MINDPRGANRVILPVGRESRVKWTAPVLEAFQAFQLVRTVAASLLRAVRTAVANMISALLDALVWFLLLMAAGAAMLVAGTYVLAGIGWALIIGGVLCICAASFIRKGMTGG